MNQMLLNNIMTLNISDWVTGKSRNGELIIGFIDRIDSENGIVKVTVATSDNDETIAKTIPIQTKFVEKLPMSSSASEEELQFLIDLALLTEDEDWFIDLSSRLNSIRQLVLK
jgi:uncharacterized protein YpiB (UPF0302 family)